MAGGSDGPDVSAGGEIWGTLEELLLAFAVCRHGTASWDSVAGSCRLRFHQLHRRFSAGGGAEEEEQEEGEVGPEAEAEASAADGWLDELRRLRVAELRREVERCDLSIGTLQSKVELMKEERERSLSSGEAKPEGVTGDENVSSEEPGRSCRESNSTDLKRPGAAAKAAEEAAKEELSGESKESAVSLQCRRRKASADEEADEPLAALLDRVAARFGPVFDQLQESQESESYRGTIRRHVDLEAMRRKLDGAAGYASSAELYRDLLLLCANAAVYLPRHAPDHAAAALNALRLVSAQVSASLREAPAKREPPSGANPPPAPAAGPDSRRAEADIVGPLIQKAAKPLIFCRKRSSIAKAAAAAAVARKEEAAEKRDMEEEAESDGEKKAALAAAAKGKAWGTGTKKTRGPGKNSALSRKKAAAAAEEAAAAAAAADKKDNGDSDGAAAGGLPKKRIAVDFLKRLNQGKSSPPKKRGSPLTKRKRSAPAPEEEEEQPKARRGAGRKNTGRGGSKAGAKASATKKSVGRPQKRGAAPATPPPAKRAKVNRSERSSSSSRRGGRK
uniref:Bromo domain-containing protein n=1 Tax=Triticum aestivum TaxID=4565 RepID=A0A3B6KHV6_WHEAT